MDNDAVLHGMTDGLLVLFFTETPVFAHKNFASDYVLFILREIKKNSLVAAVSY